jgi:hypothetical protein
MGKEKIRFHANVNPGGGGQFDQYRLNRDELPERMLSILDELASAQSGAAIGITMGETMEGRARDFVKASSTTWTATRGM